MMMLRTCLSGFRNCSWSCYLLSTLLIAPLTVTAKVISTPSNPLVVTGTGKSQQRVCYYNDKAYSIGAVLQVGEVYMLCKEANDFEKNGALRWVILEKTKQEE
ncbi:DUF1496 domain-containing protein [Vibrio aestuarianus]|uniref:DUF1496 domain-containing protein n=1 Tax=Vibrio aestuarianus TaxID=28171 RepID=UPI00237CA4DF|nr:DUF1496 domain-containing protein [Vibrio aestuarianus]MDE1338085.1 YnjH family protein [Vibrio aestuarianus]